MDPTKKNGGLSPAEMLQRAKQATQQPEPVAEILIQMNLQTGNIKIGAPQDPVLFFGMMELAKDTFRAMNEKARKEVADRRIAVVGGPLPNEARSPQ